MLPLWLFVASCCLSLKFAVSKDLLDVLKIETESSVSTAAPCYIVVLPFFDIVFAVCVLQLAESSTASEVSRTAIWASSPTCYQAFQRAFRRATPHFTEHSNRNESILFERSGRHIPSKTQPGSLKVGRIRRSRHVVALQLPASLHLLLLLLLQLRIGPRSGLTDAEISLSHDWHHDPIHLSLLWEE